MLPQLITGTVTVPDTVTHLIPACCAQCKISHIIFPSSLIEIGGYSFYGCKALEDAVIPDSVTTIDGSAFRYCSKLTSVKMSKNVTSLSAYCFGNCGLTSFEIPDSVRTIHEYCFQACNSLKKVIIPDNITMIYGNAFESTTKIEFGPNSNYYIDNQNLIIDKDNTTIVQYIGQNIAKEFLIIKTIKTISGGAFKEKSLLSRIEFEQDSVLEKISSFSFQGCTNLVFVNLPSTITRIDINAFEGCQKLEQISLSKLLALGSYSFQNCINLKTVNFGTSPLIQIGISAFSGCSKLTTFMLPENVKYLLDNAFESTPSLSTLTFLSSIETISDYCFSGSGLTQVDLSMCTKMTNISQFCFSNCINLETITFPDSIQTIGIFSFKNTKLRKLVLPVNTASIGNSAFQDCTELTYFEILENSKLQNIGLSAFRNCYNLQNISCPNDRSRLFTVMTGALFNVEMTILYLYPPASPITFFSLPGTVTTIDQGAFIGCTNLISVLIPSNSVTRISTSAFEGCSNLISINIPLCVKTVDQNAFLGCDKLVCGVYIESKNKTFIQSVIDNDGLPKSSYQSCSNRQNSIKCNIPRINPQYYLVFILM
ncbi:surface antigen BspA-like [Trichomonas vaginalis G3]|uniref:Surface antigen BspA-like n=1 Tax=Trichomonas vaginalis (strain ATCC PRA-98 / G3) TaxID=412133 RepID=A2FHI4_TRIV3|nr:antigen BSP-related family [Trichomonas vaginalis G3]EAX95619.1 surface antigen BspA-like [Trichomonas vaginalis G3]KAI5487449.1 antigen BSP-related family [Trichomonas vaginalis G3]|eukprot:XP_001308549.1 surface antigen BspA-like [Trichomonas vaginalis G3]